MTAILALVLGEGRVVIWVGPLKTTHPHHQRQKRCDYDRSF